MDKVKSYIEANKERFISELFDLLRIPSISAQSEHKPDMTRCAEWLAAALAKAGADRTEVFPTEGNPVVYAEKIVDPKAKTVLVYGHYDVMPVDPRGEWRTEPFEPVIKDGRIWGRGADDDNGQLWMHAKAFEAMCATESLPCNVKFMLEGEEEIGSPSLYKFCEQNKKMLKADIILVSDTSMISMPPATLSVSIFKSFDATRCILRAAPWRSPPSSAAPACMRPALNSSSSPCCSTQPCWSPAPCCTTT